MTDESLPPQPRTHVQLVMEGGTLLQIASSLTPDEVVAELDTKGGNTRAGYATIPGIPKGANKSETLRVWRQKLVSFVVADLTQVATGRILVPTLAVPENIVRKV